MFAFIHLSLFLKFVDTHAMNCFIDHLKQMFVEEQELIEELQNFLQWLCS